MWGQRRRPCVEHRVRLDRQLVSRNVRRAKAQRGDLFFTPPRGYVRGPGGEIVLDSDERVRDVVQLVFDTFERYGTINGVLTAEIKAQWTGLLIAAPRTQLSDLAKQKEVKQPGIYCLVGEDPENNARRPGHARLEENFSRREGCWRQKLLRRDGLADDEGQRSVLAQAGRRLSGLTNNRERSRFLQNRACKAPTEVGACPIVHFRPLAKYSSDRKRS